MKLNEIVSGPDSSIPTEVPDQIFPGLTLDRLEELFREFALQNDDVQELINDHAYDSFDYDSDDEDDAAEPEAFPFDDSLVNTWIQEIQVFDNGVYLHGNVDLDDIGGDSQNYEEFAVDKKGQATSKDKLGKYRYSIDPQGGKVSVDAQY